MVPVRRVVCPVRVGVVRRQELDTSARFCHSMQFRDEGTAEIKGGVYLNWTALGFVKENGAWKFSNKNPDVQTVDQSKGK